ncbi:hypothetical protein ACS0TY_034059 [Phlomoides rotata]
MRMSCNGCRVLRKGCTEDCTLRPCLDWIESPESQANATLFLAKFYGRAGLINLISSAPSHLHPEIFRSLLYEACGRIINPVYGSVGLMSSGEWQRCQAAVEAVLQGAPLSGDDVDSAAQHDIRHLSKESAAAFRRVRTRHSSSRAKRQLDSLATELISESKERFTITGWEFGEDHKNFDDDELKRAPSHDSVSVETVEPALVEKPNIRVKPEPQLSEFGLELTLGFCSSVIEVSDSET